MSMYFPHTATASTHLKWVRDAFQKKKRKKIQTSVKKVGGGDPQTQNKNWKLILDKSIGREGGKSVCQNFKNEKKHDKSPILSLFLWE